MHIHSLVHGFLVLFRRPRGTGFLKFSTAEAADAAVSAANAAPGLGIFIKSRALKIMKALDKESAHKKELEKSKNEVEDRRNLYLTKVTSSPEFPLLSLSLSYLLNHFSYLMIHFRGRKVKYLLGHQLQKVCPMLT